MPESIASPIPTRRVAVPEEVAVALGTADSSADGICSRMLFEAAMEPCSSSWVAPAGRIPSGVGSSGSGSMRV
eukprot:scaffold143307_cov32-Tisochrysis_lutea.AAC.2